MNLRTSWYGKKLPIVQYIVYCFGYEGKGGWGRKTEGWLNNLFRRGLLGRGGGGLLEDSRQTVMISLFCA